MLKNIQFLKNPESGHKSPFQIFFPTLLSLGQLAPTRPRPLSLYRQPTTSFLDYRKCPNLVHIQVEIISEPNYLMCILFERKFFKAPNLVRTSYFSGNLEEEKVLKSC